MGGNPRIRTKRRMTWDSVLVQYHKPNQKNREEFIVVDPALFVNDSGVRVLAFNFRNTLRCQIGEQEGSL